ncbi:MAG: hypothetical protein KAH32_06770 [Chlamydiia bacterium]|nr:hypothetical protein [Chlamydiia bacterium]
MENKKRKVYFYSTNSMYFEVDDYIDIFEKKNASFLEGTEAVFDEFLSGNEIMQLDVETNVVDFYSLRELYVIQIGDKYGYEQHIFDFTHLPDGYFNKLKEIFGSDKLTYICHNAKFEYTVIYKHFNVFLQNLEDSFLASKILSSGINIIDGFNGLKYQVESVFGITLPKDEQTTFDGGIITPNQMLYADTDVLYMGALLDRLKKSLERWGLMTIYGLECRALRPIGDFTINGVAIDILALDENISEFETDVTITKVAMERYLSSIKDEKTLAIIKKNKMIQPEDEIIINWGSPKQKKLIFNTLYPEVEFTSMSVSALNKIEDEVIDPTYIHLLISKQFSKLNNILAGQHLEFLKSNDFFIPKGTININFNSPAQLLTLFRIWYPGLAGVGAKALAKLKHPMVDVYKKHAKASKLANSFGEKMKMYVEGDGRIHGSFSQIVPSGSRSSSSKPNLQQMPSTESYRRIFIPRNGWGFVDSDYSSAELFLAAFLSQDPNMLHAVRNGYDMHSYSASLIFGEDWIAAGGSDTPIGKPTTKEANAFRKLSKALSFSLLYGTGVVAFSENLGIELSEGKRLMKKYFGTFPKLAEFFKASGQEALDNLYVKEPFFGRIRFFNKPKNGMEVSHNKNAAMNYKPQAANGSIMKYAMALMKKYIEDNNLSHKVKLLLFVHDQALTEVKNDFIDEWEKIQTNLMEKAALYAIPSGELKAESMILKHWTK